LLEPCQARCFSAYSGFSCRSDSIQIGAFLARPGSSFVKSWLDGYAHYNHFKGDYAAVSMCQPYKLYEKQPQLLLVENRLQMIYFNGWSSFIPRYLDLPQEQVGHQTLKGVYFQAFDLSVYRIS